MSILKTIGSWFPWWPKFRDGVIAEVEAIATALEPEAKAALVSALHVGVATAAQTSGTYGDKWVAARNAVLAALKASGHDIAASVVDQALHSELGSISDSVPPTP